MTPLQSWLALPVMLGMGVSVLWAISAALNWLLDSVELRRGRRAGDRADEPDMWLLTQDSGLTAKPLPIKIRVQVMSGDFILDADPKAVDSDGRPVKAWRMCRQAKGQRPTQVQPPML